MVVKDWHSNLFGNMFVKKGRLNIRIMGIQMKLMTRFGFFGGKAQKKKKIDLVLQQEELVWFQKSKKSGLLVGIGILSNSIQQKL